jgi:hypothetical protein
MLGGVNGISGDDSARFPGLVQRTKKMKGPAGPFRSLDPEVLIGFHARPLRSMEMFTTPSSLEMVGTGCG